MKNPEFSKEEIDIDNRQMKWDMPTNLIPVDVNARGLTIIEYANYCRAAIQKICADLQAKVDLVGKMPIEDMPEGAYPKTCKVEFYGKNGNLQGAMSENEHIIICLVIEDELKGTIVT